MENHLDVVVTEKITLASSQLFPQEAPEACFFS